MEQSPNSHSPSLKDVVTVAMVMLCGAYGFALAHEAESDVQAEDAAARVVEEYFSLPEVKSPSIISPFMSVRSTETFEDAPIRVIEFVDLLCPDCLCLHEQISRIKDEFKGKLNVVAQFFPLEAKCNQVVSKDLHPGACDLSYIAAYQPERFQTIYDEIWANFREAKTSAEWRMALAKKYEAEAALSDPETKDLVHRIINTGAEYEKTSDEFAHGIRSTPTMIVNNRLVIGTYPAEQLRAIFQALVDGRQAGEPEGEKRFLENWVQR